MEYSLRTCLEDKSLRGTLADAPFGFADGNGVFDLDFQEQSIRKNHRKTFDRLMELGGEELLQKLLAEGKTCLMEEKGKGTSTIAGTDRFHLKTNAGAPTALSSIFHGIAGWSEVAEDFDLDLVTCTLEEEESEEDDDLPDGEPETESWEVADRWGKPLPPQTCSLITRNGAPCFFDEENKEFISLPGTDGPVTELTACEPLMGMGRVNLHEEIMGYRYRTEPDGKWGYVSRHFTQIVPPRFDEILVAPDGSESGWESCIFAWSPEANCWGCAQFQIVCSVKAPYDRQEIWLDLAGAFTVKDQDLLPQKDGWREYSLDQKFLLYRPSAEVKKGLLLNPTFFLDQWNVTFLPGFLALENNFGPDRIRWVATNSEGRSQTDVCQKVVSAPLSDFTVKKCLGERAALIEKEGYWAVARLSNDNETGKLQVERWLTPLAFTHIEVVDENLSFLLVDQFGQLGVFNWNTEKYVVPCRYDRIECQLGLFWADGFRVHQGGFVGVIGADGSWKEHLHREEQA